MKRRFLRPCPLKGGALVRVQTRSSGSDTILSRALLPGMHHAYIRAQPPPAQNGAKASLGIGDTQPVSSIIEPGLSPSGTDIEIYRAETGVRKAPSGAPIVRKSRPRDS